VGPDPASTHAGQLLKKVAADPLEDLLRAATVRVEGGPKPGAGFFVAPRLVLTCVHVVGIATSLTVTQGDTSWSAAPVALLHDQGKPIPALDEGYPDVALLEVDGVGPGCVRLEEDWPAYDAEFQTYGYPEEGGSVELTPARLRYRGKKGTHRSFIDCASDTIKPGMSGGALLNLSSRAVCGIVVATRSRAIPDGGFAVPWVVLKPLLAEAAEANRRFHQAYSPWRAAAASTARRLRFRLPRVVESFTGRSAELDALEQSFTHGYRAVVTQTLAGLGGVGKSQLAARYVEAHLDDYDVIAWIRAEVGGVTDLAELAAELGQVVEGLSPEERAAKALRALEQEQRRWLLVLDNVASPRQLESCCPAAGAGRVVVTSRNRGFGNFGPMLSVDVFDEDTATAYLLRRRPGDEASARRVAQAVGCLPLALSHAAAYCEAGATYREYLELISNLPAAEVFDRSPEAFYEATVASTWDVSIRLAEAKAALARPVLVMAATLAPDRIPTSLFRSLLDDDTDPRQRKALADALRALHDFSLVQLGDASMDIHRLLQKVIRDEAAGRGDASGQAAALSALTTAFPTETDRPGWWPQCEQLVPHVLALGHSLSDASEQAEAGIVLLNRAVEYLLHLEGGKRAVGAGKATVSYADRLLGPDHPETLTARNNLASCYWSVGRIPEAIAIEEQVLADRERILGPDHPRTLTSRANLAESYWSVGRIPEAIAIEEQVLADSERILGPDHPATLTARNNLAASYRSAGRIPEAIAIAEQVLADFERILGPDHPATLTARNNLAISYWWAGRIPEAIAIAEQVLADRERILGPDHPGTLTARNNLANCYWSAGRIPEAIAIEEQVLADRERILGPDHPRTLTSRNNLAASYRSVGRIPEAIAIAEQVLADRERILGPDHPETLRARQALDEML
jgi:tetratricopeptide (TPR) repeat protein